MKNFKKLFGFTRLVKPLFGFTLAEVLITLSILGVVAAITVPSIINKNSERETVTKVKKIYSALSNAYDIAQAEIGTSPSTWGATYNVPISDKIFERMAVVKSCKVADTSCVEDDTYKTLDGGTWAKIGYARSYNNTPGHARYILKDGTLIVSTAATNETCQNIVGTSTELQHSCGSFYVDINGHKGPNKLGIDTFGFKLNVNSISPAGSPDNTEFPLSRCNKDLSGDGWNGMACTAWIIAKGNMDYKRKTISW